MLPEKGLNEKTYEFAFTHQLLEKIKVRGLSPPRPPKFPTTRAEAKEGYDVNVNVGGIALFFQFKISEYLISRNAKEAKNGVVDPPYFRFKIYSRARSPQHQMLFALESRIEEAMLPGFVSYAAPLFISWNDFEHYFVGNSILEHSYYVQPSMIGPIHDDEDHTVFHKPGETTGLFTEYREIKPALLWSHIVKILPERVGNDRRLDLKKLLINMIEIINEDFFFERTRWPPWLGRNGLDYYFRGEFPYSLGSLIKSKDVEKSISFIAKVFFNANFILIKTSSIDYISE